MKANIHYSTDAIEEYYKSHRISWADLYPSEKVVLERLNIQPEQSVLDIGCGCAGLSFALKERFGVEKYVGIEINEKAAKTAQSLNSEARIIQSDMLTVTDETLPSSSFDYVVSFGAIDWNVLFTEMLHKAFSFVKPGGYFIGSFRLTDKKSLFSINDAYQYINFNNERSGEKAVYTVINIADFVSILESFRPKPSSLYAYGYWGNPRPSAVIPYEQVCFSVFAVRKPETDNEQATYELDLPPDLLSTM